MHLHTGRLRDEDPVRAAQEVLKAIVLSFRGSCWKLRLMVHSKAELRWPAAPVGEHAVELKADEENRVNVGIAWRQLPSPNDQCAKLFEELVLAQGSSVSLIDLLAQLVT